MHSEIYMTYLTLLLLLLSFLIWLPFPWVHLKRCQILAPPPPLRQIFGQIRPGDQASQAFLTLSGQAFSVICHTGGGGGRGAQRPGCQKSWVIMAIKAFIDAKFESGTSSSLEIWRHKISLGRRERVSKFGHWPKTGLTLKIMSFYVQNRSFWPKIDLHVNFSNFQVEGKSFRFVDCWGVSVRKE